MAFQMPFRFGAKSTVTPIDSRARQSKMMEYDQPLVWVTLLLMLFGMVMVFAKPSIRSSMALEEACVGKAK